MPAPTPVPDEVRIAVVDEAIAGIRRGLSMTSAAEAALSKHGLTRSLKSVQDWAARQGRPLKAVAYERDHAPQGEQDVAEPPLKQATTYDASTLRRMVTRLVVETQRNIDEVPDQGMTLEYAGQASLVVKRLIDANQALDRAMAPRSNEAEVLEQLRRNESQAAGHLERQLKQMRGAVRRLQPRSA